LADDGVLVEIVGAGLEPFGFLTARLVSFELPVSERVDSVVEFVELFVLLVLLLLLLFAVVLELLLLLVDEELVLALLSVVGLGILSTSCHNA
jgi:hypothetical protein